MKVVERAKLLLEEVRPWFPDNFDLKIQKCSRPVRLSIWNKNTNHGLSFNISDGHEYNKRAIKAFFKCTCIGCRNLYESPLAYMASADEYGVP